MPNELRKEALRLIHEKESGHLGQHKSILKAEDYFYWPNLRKGMKAFVREYITCQQIKMNSGLQQQWQELPPVDQPMERVSIDITEMGSGAIGQKYVLTRGAPVLGSGRLLPAGTSNFSKFRFRPELSRNNRPEPELLFCI